MRRRRRAQNMMINRIRHGFSMLEMVIVLAVISILALMAVPSMFDSTIRQQVQDGAALSNVAKVGVMTAYALTNEMPANNEAAGVPLADKIVGNYITRVEVVDGAVTLTFGNSVNSSIKGKKLTFRPAVVKDSPTVPIAWLCNTAAVPNGMTVFGANRTDIPAKWLPISCR